MLDENTEKFLTTIFLPVNIGMAALFYTFAFSFFKNLLKELDDYLHLPTTNRNVARRSQEYNKVASYFRSGKLVMNLLFWWAAISFVYGVVCLRANTAQETNEIFWRIALGIISGGICLLSSYLLYVDSNNNDIGPGIAVAFALPTFGSLIITFLIFSGKLSATLPTILDILTAGLMYYLIGWFILSVRYSPLRSLQKLRGTI